SARTPINRSRRRITDSSCRISMRSNSESPMCAFGFGIRLVAMAGSLNVLLGGVPAGSTCSRPNSYLQHRSYIALAVGCQNRERPRFVLHRGGDVEDRSQTEVHAHTGVRHRSSIWNKLTAQFLMTKRELQFVLRIEPICAPCLCALTATADPTAH